MPIVGNYTSNFAMEEIRRGEVIVGVPFEGKNMKHNFVISSAGPTSPIYLALKAVQKSSSTSKRVEG